MQKNYQYRSRSGFTLVELLVVVLILSILMAVAVPLYLDSLLSSAKGTARANMQTIANAEQAYRLGDPNHGYLPIAVGATDADWAALGGVSNAIHGPGDRTYTVTLGDGALTCVDNTGMMQTPVAGSFFVQSHPGNDGNGGDPPVGPNPAPTFDGCFVPGVTNN